MNASIFTCDLCGDKSEPFDVRVNFGPGGERQIHPPPGWARPRILGNTLIGKPIFSSKDVGLREIDVCPSCIPIFQKRWAALTAAVSPIDRATT